MRTYPDGHQEPHKQSFTLSDVILGGQDGLVNVLGVILGVAAASGDQRIVVAAGLAATFAESVSMAAVAYTSTLAEADYYRLEREKEAWEIENMPEKERQEIRSIYQKKGFEGEILETIVKTITKDKTTWLNVMMNDELHLQPQNNNQALRSAIIVGASAVVGSFIPLTPFFFVDVKTSSLIALVIAALTLFFVGAYKAQVTVGRWYRSGIQMMVIGITSALVGYAVGLLFKAPVVP